MKSMILAAVMVAAGVLEASAQTAPASVAAQTEAPMAITTDAGRQEIKGEVQMRGALLRTNDDLLAKDEEIAQLKYFLAKLQRAVNDRDKARMEPDLLKSFNAPPGSSFDWRNFKVIPPPPKAAATPAPPAAPSGVKVEAPAAKTTP